MAKLAAATSQDLGIPRDSGQGIRSPFREQKSLVVFFPCSLILCSHLSALMKSGPQAGFLGSASRSVHSAGVYSPVCLDEVWTTGGFPGLSVQVCTLCWSHFVSQFLCTQYSPVCLDEVWSTSRFPGLSVQICTLCWSHFVSQVLFANYLQENFVGKN